jgi:hypothetical protein
MSDFPSIQGQYVSWAEVQPALQVVGGATTQTRDFKAIEWDDSLVPGKVRGTGPFIIGRTVGEYDANASISMYYSKAIIFMETLAMVKSQIGLVPFDLPVSWSPLDGIGDVYSIRMVGCKLTKREVKIGPGSDAMAITMPLSVIRIAFYDRFGNELNLI